MLSNFSKGSVMDVWRGPECVSECGSIKSYEWVAAETILSKWKFSQRKIPEVLRN